MGSYLTPFNVMLSGFYQYVSGTHFTRTVNSSSALGRQLNQGNVAVLAGPRNEDSYEALNILDFRAAYDVPWSAARLSLQFDMFNALNANTITNAQTLSGAAYGRVIEFLPPRIFRFGAKIRF
jgi:outer membrane receptor protein involved in Fe transport